MTSVLRDHCTREQLAAHAVLDLVRAGEDVPKWRINHALATLGEPVHRTEAD